jgi:hypothetical protein
MSKAKIFFIKFLIIASPLLALLSVYMITDPFKVIYSYHFDNYYNWQHWELNRELVSVENLRERIVKSDTPDSYIFGSSRSFVFRCNTWESFLNDHTKPYHFDAASETLYGVYNKVKYLDRNKVNIKNVLLICDVTVFSKTENEYDITHIKHPDISGESRFAYQNNFIKGYFSNFFFFKQIDYILSGRVKHYMGDIFVIEPGYIRTEAYENDYYYQTYDSMLRTDSIGYYEVFKKNVFDERPKQQVTSDAVIKEKQIVMLKEMKRIFDKDNTRFKIVISPIYNQKKINEADLKILTDIFGPTAVFDYSGKNEITESKTNYYEASHFKPYIAQKIMADIYSK